MYQSNEERKSIPVLTLGATSEAPLVKLYESEMFDECNKVRNIDMEESGVDRLSPIFQEVPGLLIKGKESSEKIMKVVVDGPLSAAADGDGLRAFVRNENNLFVEHARLYETSGLSQLISANVVFNIASTVVAQKHLADINEKLVEIKEGVEKVKKFQENERKSKITGAVEYLQQVSPVVIGGHATSHVRQQLESIESNLAQVQHHLLKDIQDLSDDNGVSSKKFDFFAKNIRQGILKRQDKMSDILQQWWLCLSSRLLACRLLAYFPGERELAKARYAHLKETADKFLYEDISKFLSSVRAAIGSVSSVFETKSEQSANRISLLEWEEDFLHDFFEKAKFSIKNNEACLIENESPVEIFVKVSAGRIDQCFAVENTPN